MPQTDSPQVYIPALWLHNRAVVRRKGTTEPEYVLRRLKCGETRASTTVELVVVTKELLSREGLLRCPAYVYEGAEHPVAEVEDHYELTGKIMSILSAPL
jgi:hypothetical protein